MCCDNGCADFGGGVNGAVELGALPGAARCPHAFRPGGTSLSQCALRRQTSKVGTVASRASTGLCGGQRATAVPTATPSHAPSKDRKPGGSSRSQSWAGSIIGTNVAPLERTDGVESQQQTTNYSIAIPGTGRFFSPAQAEPIPQTQTDNNFGSLIRVCVDERRSPQDPAGCVC